MAGHDLNSFEGSTPRVTVAEPDLLRDILVKDFHIFPYRKKMKFPYGICHACGTSMMVPPHSNVQPCTFDTRIIGYGGQEVAEATDGDSDTELWFQQDGATCHTARATIDLLKDTCGDRLISRFGPVNWPPRSCDLTPLDYFLWGYVKSLVYADKPQTLDHLEDNIRRVIADIRPQMLEKVIENWMSRLDYIQASCGSPMPEIIFKM
ncbi:putative LOC100569746 [Trichonephila clavipes]|nr:putative LOC100569746 [Trichonephila clavipes]